MYVAHINVYCEDTLVLSEYKFDLTEKQMQKLYLVSCPTRTSAWESQLIDSASAISCSTDSNSVSLEK